jgi:hypothetical protein
MPPNSSQRSNSRCSFLDKVAQLSKRRHANDASIAVMKSDETIASSGTSSSSNSCNRSWRNIIVPVKWQSGHSLSSSSSKKKTRRVRFDEAQNQYFDNTHELCDVEDVMEDLWYNKFELTMFQSKVAIVCARITRDESGNSNSNNSAKSKSKNRPSSSAHHNHNHHLPSYQHIVQCTFDECTRCNDEENDIHLLPEQYENWIQLLRRHPGRMGLEKYIVQTIATRQFERQQKMVEMVQFLTVESNNTATESKKKQHNISDEMIRQACMTASLPSRLFARFTALANAETEVDDDSSADTADVLAISDSPAADAAATSLSLLDQEQWPHRALLDDEGIL